MGQEQEVRLEWSDELMRLAHPVVTHLLAAGAVLQTFPMAEDRESLEGMIEYAESLMRDAQAGFERLCDEATSEYRPKEYRLDDEGVRRAG